MSHGFNSAVCGKDLKSVQSSLYEMIVQLLSDTVNIAQMIHSVPLCSLSPFPPHLTFSHTLAPTQLHRNTVTLPQLFLIGLAACEIKATGPFDWLMKGILTDPPPYHCV